MRNRRNLYFFKESEQLILPLVLEQQKRQQNYSNNSKVIHRVREGKTGKIKYRRIWMLSHALDNNVPDIKNISLDRDVLDLLRQALNLFGSQP